MTSARPSIDVPQIIACKLQQSGDVFPRAEIVSLERLSVPEIQSRLDTLKNEISAIPGVTGFG